MIDTLDALNGQKWARRTLMLALAVSIGYNIANIVLTDTAVHVALRIPQGIVWPAFLFLGIEVMIRNKDLQPKLAKIARFFLMGVTVPTAITSYINLHDFMVKANEPGVAQISGPLAIDGLMLGCTLYLLASRQAPSLAVLDIDVDEVLARHGVTEELPIPVSPAPAPTVEEVAPVSPAAPRSRAARTVEWNVHKVAEMAVDGAKAPEIAAAAGISPAVAYRYTKAAKTLKADPNAEIPPTDKVRPEAVRIMRELVSR